MINNFNNPKEKGGFQAIPKQEICRDPSHKLSQL